MSRPKPKIILSYTDPKTYKAEQVLAATAVYAVYYDSKPINLRSLHTLLDYPGPKYRKSAYAAPGHCFNLATRLNNLFKTDKFAVYALTSGVLIHETDSETT